MKLTHALIIALFSLSPAAAFAGMNYTNTELKGQNLTAHDLRQSSFVNSDVVQTNFSGSDLEGSTFTNINFKGGSMAGASLRNATFSNVDFGNVDIRGADFTGSTFTNCNLELAHADENTDFTQVTMVNTGYPGTEISTSGRQNPISEPTNVTVDTPGVNLYAGDSGVNISVGQPGVGGTRVNVPGVNIEVGDPAPREFQNAQVIVAALEKPNSKVDLTVNFAFDSDKILDAGHKQVFEIAEALNNPALAGKNIRIEGHTDSKGTDAYNEDLSYRRAVSVLSELKTKYQVNTAALKVEGYGESQPIATNDSEAGRALNRRVTLINMGI